MAGQEGQRKEGALAEGRQRREGQVGNGFPCWLRKMDFLNIPVKLQQADATARDSPSRLIAGFW